MQNKSSLLLVLAVYSLKPSSREIWLIFSIRGCGRLHPGRSHRLIQLRNDVAGDDHGNEDYWNGVGKDHYAILGDLGVSDSFTPKPA